MRKLLLLDLHRLARMAGVDVERAAESVVQFDGAWVVVDDSHSSFPRPGLGDHVAAGLAAVGITKDRAQAVAQAVGLEDCGCQQRQDALNRVGYKFGLGTPPSDAQPTSAQ